jgi:hypothetical protein
MVIDLDSFFCLLYFLLLWYKHLPLTTWSSLHRSWHLCKVSLTFSCSWPPKCEPRERWQCGGGQQDEGPRTDTTNNNNQNQQHLTWCQAFYQAYMSRGRRVEDRSLRSNNRGAGRTSRSRTTAAVRKINETFRILFERMKLFTRSAITRTSSPEVTETNEECLESGERSAAASP